MLKKSFTAVCLTLTALLPLPALAQNALAPMGWSSWNSFSNTIDSRIALAQAHAMAASGLQKAGYQYVNIDEGWWLGARDADGNFIVDPKAWPALEPGEQAGDMSNIVRAIHQLGLKAGIYTDAGHDGCSLYPDLGPAYFHVGSASHYEQDFLQFARWGFDYVKVDWCGGDKENLDPQVQYAEIARAIARAEQLTGRRLYYSICNWGKHSPWSWGPGIGGSPQAIWRTSGDIVDPVVASGEHAGRKVSFEKMMENFDKGIHPEAQHTGYFNDPDMMVLGMPGMTPSRDRLHMALWAISGAPLLIGADLEKLSSKTLATFSNAEAIQIDQDPLGLQAIKVGEIAPGLEIWSKMLATPGERAVILLNRTNFPAPMKVSWGELGLAGDTASVRDIWTAKDQSGLKDAFNATVPAQDGVFLLVKGSEGSFVHFAPAAKLEGIRDQETRFTGLAASASASAWAQVKISYKNSASSARLVELRVNGQNPTRILFAPSASGAAWVEVNLDGKGSANTLTFATGATSEFEITGIDAH